MDNIKARVVSSLSILLQFCQEYGVDFHAAIIQAEDEAARSVVLAEERMRAPIPSTAPGHRGKNEPGTCSVCKRPYRHLGQHFRYHPECHAAGPRVS